MSPKINRFLIPFLFVALLILSNTPTNAQQGTTQVTYLPLLPYHQAGWIGPWGGYIVATAIDPADPHVMYAGTWGAGVFKSVDGGKSWLLASNGLDNLYINSLVVDPVHPRILYAGTYKNQVYKSSDAGKSWAWSGTGMQDQAVVYSMAIDPQNPSTLYAGTRGISNNGNPPWGGILYKSTNAGASWTAALEDVGGEDVQDWVYSIAVHPTESHSIYIATHEHGPFHSNDNGISWYSIHDGINDDSGRAILISPDTSDDTIMYYGVWHFDSVYKSLDGGNDWFLSNHGIAYTKVYHMAIDPLFPKNVYLATFTRGVLKTEDGGESWISAGLRDDLIYNLSIDPITTTIVIAGTAGDGLYRSLDGSKSWLSSSYGIDNAMTTKVIVSATNPNKLFTSVYGAGVYQSTDRGSTWETMNTGLGDKFVHTLVQDPSHPNRLYALTDTGGLYRDDLESGLGWVSLSQDLPPSLASQPALPADHPLATREIMESNFVPEAPGQANQAVYASLFAMVFAPSDAQVAYLGTGGSGVYKSMDGGENWQPAGLTGETIQNLAVDPLDGDHIYAATTVPGSLKVSTDGGTSWSDSNLPVTFYTLAASPLITDTLYAGTSDGLYRYQSGTWTQSGLDGLAVVALTFDLTLPEKIYAGTSSGAYLSVNGGSSWSMLDWNLKDLTVSSIDIDPTDHGRLYFSTRTHGIYYRSMGY